MDFDYRLLAKYLTGMLSPEEISLTYNTPEHIEKVLNGLNVN